MNSNHDGVHVFETKLRWMAIAVSKAGLKRLTFDHATPLAALKSLGPGAAAQVSEEDCPLVQRLQAYTADGADDFLDIDVDYATEAPFTLRVLKACRRIPLGETISYQELAAQAGSPRAARAVGQAMAHNRIPLVIPCHRVVGSGGIGGYSASRGLVMKRLLLDLERAAAAV